MKKCYLLILVLLPLCAGILSAQTSQMNVEKVIEFYSTKNSVESVEISPQFMAMMAGQSGGDKELFSKVSGIKVISMSKESNSTKDAITTMMEQMREAVKKDNYNQIMKVKSDGSLVEMHVRDSTLLFLVQDDKEGVVLYINGKVDADLIKAVMDGQITIK